MAPPAPATDEFAVRYYRWALDDFRREIRENFPLLRTVKESLAIRLVGYMESLSVEERLELATALVKRNHRKALEITGDVWATAEEELVRTYRDVARIPRPEEAEWQRALLSGSDRFNVNRGRFLVAVKDELAPVLGSGGEPFSTKDEWRYRTPIGPWSIETYIDVGGRAPLGYFHSIRAGEPRPLREGVSLLGWLGIGGGHTLWSQLTEADTPSAAKSLSRICAHFVQAAPGLLAGLSPA